MTITDLDESSRVRFESTIAAGEVLAERLAKSGDHTGYVVANTLCESYRCTRGNWFGIRQMYDGLLSDYHDTRRIAFRLRDLLEKHAPGVYSTGISATELLPVTEGNPIE